MAELDVPETVEIPAHVPSSLVYDYNYFREPEFHSGTPQLALLDRFRGGAPDIFFTPRNAGHWVVTRAADAREMLSHPENYSSDPMYNSFVHSEPRAAPLSYDPPDSLLYRGVLNPYFGPVGIRDREAEIRAVATALIDQHLAQGACEFMTDIAKRYPVAIFLKMVNAPMGDRERLIEIADRAIRDPDWNARQAALFDLQDYVDVLIAERRKNPAPDMLSHIVHAKFQGRAMTEEEIQGMTVLVFLGGLDTVVASLSYVMSYLARHPAQYKRLVEDPGLVRNTVDELMRVHGVSCFERGLTHDLDYAGLRFKKYDRVLFQAQLFGLDDKEVEDPTIVDFDRKPIQPLVFGYGAHRCIGANLARAEFRAFLEEWVKRVPAFSLKPDTVLASEGGIVWALNELPLVWRPRASNILSDRQASQAV